METVLKTKIANRGWRFYEKASWKSPKEGQSLYGEKENDKVALMHNPYAVAWKINRRGYWAFPK